MEQKVKIPFAVFLYFRLNLGFWRLPTCGVSIGGDERPCIWAHYVEDGSGAKYYILEDYVVGEYGVICIDDFCFPIY